MLAERFRFEKEVSIKSFYVDADIVLYKIHDPEKKLTREVLTRNTLESKQISEENKLTRKRSGQARKTRG